jgi:hypothetical protein
MDNCFWRLPQLWVLFSSVPHNFLQQQIQKVERERGDEGYYPTPTIHIQL